MMSFGEWVEPGATTSRRSIGISATRWSNAARVVTNRSRSSSRLMFVLPVAGSSRSLAALPDLESDALGPAADASGQCLPAFADHVGQGLGTGLRRHERVRMHLCVGMSRGDPDGRGGGPRHDLP